MCNLTNDNFGIKKVNNYEKSTSNKDHSKVQLMEVSSTDYIDGKFHGTYNRW